MLPAQTRAVFISYAHADNQNPDPQKRWLDRFIEFLKPLVRQEDFTLCSDQEIKIGENRVLTTSNRYSVSGIPVDIPSSGIFRVVGGGLALGLCFIERSSEY